MRVQQFLGNLFKELMHVLYDPAVIPGWDKVNIVFVIFFLLVNVLGKKL